MIGSTHERLGGAVATSFPHDGPEPDSRVAKTEPPGRLAKPSRQRILLIEDDRGIREVLKCILEDEGYSVVVADNGQRGLEILRSSPTPDIIVLDLRMPVMDGWEF